MIKFFRFLLIVGALFFIFLNVYIATLPSQNNYSYKIACEDVEMTSIKKQIVSFQNWKKAPTADSEKLVALQKSEPLLNQLKVILKNGTSFSVENQVISDTLIVQHIYGLGGKQASKLSWKLKGTDCLSLNLEEYLGNKQKLLKGLGLKNSNNNYLKNISKELMNLNFEPVKKYTLDKNISPLEDLKNIKAEKRIKKDTIIYVPK